MIGLSVSLCVSDIAKGKVAFADVEKIVGGTNIQTDEKWELLIEEYLSSYWYENPDECERIFRQLLTEGKIKQPRAEDGRFPILVGKDGPFNWVKNESEIKWSKKVVKTFAELEGSESVTFEELQDTLDEYATEGSAISYEVVKQIVDKMDLSAKQLTWLVRLSADGWRNHMNRCHPRQPRSDWNNLVDYLSGKKDVALKKS